MRDYLAGLLICAAAYLLGGCSGLREAVAKGLPARCHTERGCEITLFSKRF